MRKILIALMLVGLQLSAMASDLSTIAVVTTGGTIAQKITGSGLVPTLTGDDLVAAVPALTNIAKLKVVNFSNIDSSHMSPQMWADLSKVVNKLLADPDITGVVVTHGTDTMAEGAYFLDLTVTPGKPVVFTGAMRSASDSSPDGPQNLYNAVLLASSPVAKDWGVVLAMNQYINSAREVRKTQTENVQSFDSGNKGYLGYIEAGHVYFYNQAPKHEKLPIPEKIPDVVCLTTYPGDDGRFVRYAVDSGAQGIVVEAMGSGNVNPATFEAIKYALEKKVPVVIGSSVHCGVVRPIYGSAGGGATLEKAGAIMTGDLSATKARILLMLVIPQAGGNVEKIREYFLKG